MSGVISTRNGVPPPGEMTASDPPGGVPHPGDPDTHPHPAPDEGMPRQVPEEGELPNEPAHVPPRREAQGREAHSNHRSHHKK